MELSRVYMKSTKEIQDIIINLGSAMFVQLGLDKMRDEEVIMKFNSINQNGFDEVYQEKIDKLEDNVKELKKEKKSSDKDHQDELKEKRAQLNESHKEEIQGMKEQLNLQKQEKDEEIKRGVKDRVDIYEQCHNDKIAMIEKLHKVTDEKNDEKILYLKEEIKKQDNILNEFLEERMLKDTEKGQHAEDVLKNILTRCLPFDTKAIHIPTERILGSGDCIINFSQKYNNLRLMIEMKFKTAITPKDHEQFRTHYTDDFKNEKIDLAMMISYDHKYITGHDCCLVHKYDKNNKKVIYFALDKGRTPKEKEEKIINGLEEICEEYIHNNNKDIETENTSNNYVIQVEERLKDLKNHEILINKVIKTSKNQVKEAEENKLNLEKTRNILIHELYKDGTIDKINPTLRDENIDQLKIEFFNDIKQLMKNKNVSLIQPNKSGKRNKWKDTLKKDLEIHIKPYEKKLWDKMKPDNLI